MLLSFVLERGRTHHQNRLILFLEFNNVFQSAFESLPSGHAFQFLLGRLFGSDIGLNVVDMLARGGDLHRLNDDRRLLLSTKSGRELRVKLRLFGLYFIVATLLQMLLNV